MPVAVHGRLSEFQPGVDNVEDYKSVSCSIVRRTRSQARNPRSRRKLSVGSATYTLLKNLMLPIASKPQDKSLDELFTLLQQRYEPKIIVIAERFRFYKRQQEQSRCICWNFAA